MPENPIILLAERVRDLDRQLERLRTRESTVIRFGTPASSSATGRKGEIWVDENYIYVATATDSWKRVALNTY